MIYTLAKEMHLNGYVKNGSDGLHVLFNASENNAGLFFEKIKREAPLGSKIIFSELREINNIAFNGFTIVVENDTSWKRVLISPDKAICDECRNELHDKNNRRYRYPFITCTHCGPRYSVINALPYERQDTFMQNFPMCTTCFAEYEMVLDRRFFSQTNSCKDCGIELCIKDKGSFSLFDDPEKVLLNISVFIGEGKIIALKGIGGYLLLCDATNIEAISLLRKRKHRPAKPFAVLYPSIGIIQQQFELIDEEKIMLQSEEAPIVLLYPKKGSSGGILIDDVAPGLNRVGAMLPYTPLLDLISKDYGKPIIATSANISGSPIIHSDIDAFDNLFEIADYIVTHSNKIAIPQDDSVVQVSHNTSQQIILRRSRGYAPSFLHYTPQKKPCVLATGAFIKSSFTFSVNSNVFVSQFLGSGETYESQEMYKNTLDHWLELYDAAPLVIITDAHPGYFSHQYAIELGEKYKADVKFIQHHEAHFAAVLAENNLLYSKEPVLGIIWDGTGLGTDGNMWGGEFFKYENNEMVRYCHFDYFPAIAGDKLALEPRIAALCVSAGAWPFPETLRDKFTEREWNNYQSMVSTTRLFSSSAGRIFDAVASLLGLCDKQTYEGEAAMYLQSLAENYVVENGWVMNDAYFKERLHNYHIPVSNLIQGIVMDMKNGKSTKYIAAKFHYSLVCIIDIVAKNSGLTKICCSGGVFQNSLLTDWIQIALNKKYDLYFHKNLSPNDENVSFGQLVYYDNNIQQSQLPGRALRNKTKKNEKAVLEKINI